MIDAVQFAQAHELPWPRDPNASAGAGRAAWGLHQNDPAPFDRLRGPVHARGPQSGVVFQHGREIAAWASRTAPT